MPDPFGWIQGQKRKHFPQFNGIAWEGHTLVPVDIGMPSVVGAPSVWANSGAGALQYVAPSAAKDVLNAPNGLGTDLSFVQLDHTYISDFATAAVAALFPAWAAYTPTVVSTGGTLTSASGAGRWLLVGETLHFSALATITTNGTGSGEIDVGLPNLLTAKAQSFIGGRETTINGKALTGTILANGGIVKVHFYDNTYPGADGATLNIGGVVEVN